MPRSSAASSRRRRSDAPPNGLAWDDGDHSEPTSQIIQDFGELVEGFVVVKYLGHVSSLLTLVMVASYPPPGYSQASVMVLLIIVP